MDVKKTIPEELKTHTIRLVAINPNRKIGIVHTVDLNHKPHQFTVDLSDAWDNASTANKTVIKAFLKKIVELALEVPSDDIIGDVLP